GSSYPENYNGNEITPMEGKSLMSAFSDENIEERTLCFEHEENCAIRRGDWKLSKVREKDWELYNIREDRTELHNLRDEYPELLEELKNEWYEWADRINVYPRRKK